MLIKAREFQLIGTLRKRALADDVVVRKTIILYYNIFNELMENPFLSLTILRREQLTNSDHVAALASNCLTLYMECI